MVDKKRKFKIGEVAVAIHQEKGWLGFSKEHIGDIFDDGDYFTTDENGGYGKCDKNSLFTKEEATQKLKDFLNKI